MPVGTVDPNEYTRYELKTLPPVGDEEGGFVMLRPLPYGAKLSRRDKATRMSMEQKVSKPGRKQQDETQTINIDTLTEMANAHDFAYCIGDHNITDKAGQLLDFTNPLTLKLLNPKLGSEIERYLMELNEDEDEESLEDFTKRLTTSSTSET